MKKRLLPLLFWVAVDGKGASKGGAGGGSTTTDPSDAADNELRATLARRNWMIYGPILVVILLILLCMFYDKIYQWYTSLKFQEKVTSMKSPSAAPNTGYNQLQASSSVAGNGYDMNSRTTTLTNDAMV